MASSRPAMPCFLARPAASSTSMSRRAMADVLAGIVERKRSEVADRLRGRSFDVRPSTRSLRDALGRRGARFIMEVKRASPSGHRSSVPVADAARAYAPVADAISVLTDGPAFAGSLDDLAEVR